MARRQTFAKEICVRKDSDGYELIVGHPDAPENIDAEHGQKVAIYRLERVATFRLNPRLDGK